MFNLTAPQRNVLETESFFKNTSISNIGGYAIFSKEVDFQKMEEAINLLLQKADGLRLRMRQEGVNTMQYVEDYQHEEVIPFEVTGDILEESNRWMQTPFALEGKLYDFKLYTYQGGQGIYIKLHHLIADGWSMALVLSKVIEYYDSLMEGQTIEEELPSYKVFVDSEQEYLHSEQYKRDEIYWKEKYSVKPTYVSLTPSKTGTSVEGVRKSFFMTQSQKEKLEAYCRENKITPAVFFEAIVCLYAARVNNATDITLCSLGFNRTNRLERKIVGMFHNILPMTVAVDWKAPFISLCEGISKEHYEIFRHQKYPYEKMLRKLK